MYMYYVIMLPEVIFIFVGLRVIVASHCHRDERTVEHPVATLPVIYTMVSDRAVLSFESFKLIFFASKL